MKKIIFFAVIFVFFKILTIQAQTNQINGYVYDKVTGEPIIGAVVIFNTSKYTSTNNFGYYSFKTKLQEVEIQVNYIGYQNIDTIILLKNNIKNLNFDMVFDNNIDEVIVNSNKFVSDVSTGTIDLSIVQVKNLPSLAGETDILKVLQLYPGVSGGVEGMSGLFVRGGSPDQNLILMDDVAVYGSSHIFGFLSVFNEDAIKNVKLIKDGFPARYSGRLSSVLDVRIKDGNSNKISGNASIGLISSKFLINGPIVKDKLTFLFSFRRTYFDIVKNLYNVIQKDAQHSNFHFYDLNTKIVYKFSPKDKLFLSVYTGQDDYASKERDTNELFKSALLWGNTISAVKWTHNFSKTTFLLMQLSYSNYHLQNDYYSEYSDTNNAVKIENNYASYIRDISSKIFATALFSNGYKINYGATMLKHYYLPGKLYNLYEINSSKTEQTNSTTEISAIETNFFIENHINIADRLKFNLGINYSVFNYASSIFSYPEPRIASTFVFSQNISFKASYSLMHQYLHLLTNSGVGLPSDVWIPATSKLKPEKSQQLAGGFFLNKNNVNISITGFYKTFDNLTEYKPGASFFLNSKNWEDKILSSGSGMAYGFELFVNKNIGKWQTILAYTLSWNNRQFKELNDGDFFPFKYDNRHNVDVSFIYNINDNIKVSLVWVFKSGNAVTIPVGVYQSTLFPPQPNVLHIPNIETITHSTSYTNIMFDDTGILLHSKRNAFRMPAYHRLDISCSFSKEKNKYTRIWKIGIYNAYNQLNPFFLDFNLESINNQYKAVYRIKGLIPILPFVNYSIVF